MKERVCYKCRFITFLLQAEPWTARPLHSSVVSGREFAIEVSHPVKGIHHLQCDSQGHVERWLAEFHQNKCPDRNNRRRHATQLELWVSEAKVKNEMNFQIEENFKSWGQIINKSSNISFGFLKITGSKYAYKAKRTENPCAL